MWRRLPIALALLLPAGLLSACSVGDSGEPEVVASFYPLQYVAQRVVGDHAKVVNLTAPGVEPHDVELSPRQVAKISGAKVVFYEKGLSPAVDDAVKNNGPHRQVNAAEAVHLRHGSTSEDGDNDPHFWLDPTKLSRVAVALERQVAAADPGHAADYARNLAGLRSDLAALDRSFRTGLASCRTTTIVVSHDAFGYLGRRYGLEVVGINGLSPDAEPSPAHVRALQDLIRRDGITTVFSEQLGSRAFADSLAGDLGIKAAVLDPIEGLSDATAGQDYLSLMRQNLRTLQKANQCT